MVGRLPALCPGDWFIRVKRRYVRGDGIARVSFRFWGQIEVIDRPLVFRRNGIVSVKFFPGGYFIVRASVCSSARSPRLAAIR
jgi:hypothetical protein